MQKICDYIDKGKESIKKLREQIKNAENKRKNNPDDDVDLAFLQQRLSSEILSIIENIKKSSLDYENLSSQLKLEMEKQINDNVEIENKMYSANKIISENKEKYQNLVASVGENKDSLNKLLRKIDRLEIEKKQIENDFENKKDFFGELVANIDGLREEIKNLDVDRD